MISRANNAILLKYFFNFFSMIFLQSTAWLQISIRCANFENRYVLPTLQRVLDFLLALPVPPIRNSSPRTGRCGRSSFEGMGASDASDPEEPLFAIQHSGNRRVARNSVSPALRCGL